MKMATIYFNKHDIAEKLGIDVNQFVFGEVESNYNEVTFDVIISNDAETDKASKSVENPANVRRQPLFEKE